MNKRNSTDEESLKDESLGRNDEMSEKSEKSEKEEVPCAEEESVHDQLTKAQAEAAEYKDKYLRQVAEFDNYRKRIMKEKAELIKNGGEKVISSILPIIDDFERASDNLEKMDDVTAIKDGIILIIDKFMTILKKEGLEKIDAVGQPFDVDFHEAIAMVPSPSDEMKGKVIDCVQAGYKLNDKVIRHSKVAVAQ